MHGLDIVKGFDDVIGLRAMPVYRRVHAIDPKNGEAIILRRNRVPAIGGNETGAPLRYAERLFCHLVDAHVGFEDADVIDRQHGVKQGVGR